MHAIVSLWRSEDNLQNLVLSFCYVGRGDGTQGIRTGSSHIYAHSHLHSISVLKLLNTSFQVILSGNLA